MESGNDMVDRLLAECKNPEGLTGREWSPASDD